MDFMLLLDMISIHAPRTGSDFFPDYGKRLRHISIHAPRTGSDKFNLHTARNILYFNPRSPHGERREHLASTLTAE